MSVFVTLVATSLITEQRKRDFGKTGLFSGLCDKSDPSQDVGEASRLVRR